MRLSRVLILICALFSAAAFTAWAATLVKDLLFCKSNATHTFFTANDGTTSRERWALLVLAKNIYLPLVVR